MKHFVIVLLAVAAFMAPVAVGYCEVYEADYMPWSGYWWPFEHGGIVTGLGYHRHPSPLEKYDLVTTGSEYGPARSFGMRNYYDPNALPWEGMCGFWAAASILEPEPVHKGIVEGVVFYVGDKKALLTAAYDGVIFQVYSVQRPEDFHQVLADFIRDRRQPVIIDLAVDGEIWNFPVFKYETSQVREDNILHYTTTIYYATDAVHPDYVGTFVTHSTFTYYFIVDGEEIIDSGWEGDSVGNPPRKAWEPFWAPPRNEKFSYAQVKKIVNSNDDRFENNNSFLESVHLSTGFYNLLALDDDFFAVDLKTGDRLHVSMESPVETDLSLRFYDSGYFLLEEGASEFEFEAYSSGTFYLSVEPDHPEEEAEYGLTINQDLMYRSYFPIDPPGAWTNGLAFSCVELDAGRAILAGIDRNGRPGSSFTQLFGSQFSIMGGADNFGISTSDDGYLRIDTDLFCAGLQAPMFNDTYMLGSNMISDRDAAVSVFYPHVARKNGWQTFYGLINVGEQDETIVRHAFDQTGRMVGSDAIDLQPGQKVENDVNSIDPLVSDAVSMEAFAASGRQSLVGYIKFLNPSTASKGRALVPMIVKPDYYRLIIPNVSTGRTCWTGIAVMNTIDKTTNISCAAYDENGNEISTKSYLLQGMGSLVIEAGDLFAEVLSADIASIQIVAMNGNPLSGLVVYGLANRKQLAGMPICPPLDSPLYLPHVASSKLWRTEIGLMNAGNEEDEINVFAYDAGGEIVAESFLALSPNERFAGTVTDFFQDQSPQIEKMRYMEFESFSGQPLSGNFLIKSQDNIRWMGDVLVPGE